MQKISRNQKIMDIINISNKYCQLIFGEYDYDDVSQDAAVLILETMQSDRFIHYSAEYIFNNKIKSFIDSKYTEFMESENIKNDLIEKLSYKYITEDEKSFYRNILNSEIKNAIKTLTDREQLMLSEFFGFESNPKDTVIIGQENSLSAERVRQILLKSLRKLRSKSRSSKLENFDEFY